MELPYRLIQLYTFENEIILDPFMGSGSTIAAASSCGLKSIGLEINPDYFKMAQEAIPQLVAFIPKDAKGNGSKR